MDEGLVKMLDLQWFHENGWMRKTCPTCKDAFWTEDAQRTLCGDSTCEEYQFLGEPLTDSPLSLAEMREAFLAYWEKAPVPHTRVPRNPVVARWRDDLYLNIASIANYQPHVTSGDVKPPANPLVVSQPCIRLNDLANIGRSGRHFSCFEMMGHHAFNSPGWGQHYWTEECVAWGHGFLTDALGLDGSRITYKESMWNGGGNAGPCLEVFAGGLEVATLVFMCLQEADDGAYEIKGDRYEMMDLRIIDTGWGLERLAWASTGTPTAYDTVFPDTIAELKAHATVPIADDERSQRLVEMHARVQGVLNLDVGTRLDRLRAEVVARMAEHGITTTVQELEEVMGPIEAMYGLADHLRCLSFMVGDGVVPGNVKAGYLMRLLFRRAFRFRDTLGIEAPLSELLEANLRRMLAEFPEFEDAIHRAVEMAGLEQERYVESRERGKRIVLRIMNKNPKGQLYPTIVRFQPDAELLVDLYDTHGIGPDAVEDAAREYGYAGVDIPDDFEMVLAERHSREKKAKTKGIVPADVPATRRIFYENEGQDVREFEATVTGRFDSEYLLDLLGEDSIIAKDATTLVTLSDSCFFHETGGQPGDTGRLILEDGTHLDVLHVSKDGDHAVHHVKDPDRRLQEGVKVRGIVDWPLRMDHTRSHTATHIMNQAVRRVLGAHSWQAGTQKYHDCARVDMTHYRRPTPDELARIEALANQVVMDGRKVTRTWWDRSEAEAKYGMTLLQGGIPKGSKVRVVAIEGDGPDQPWDVEYCGGTHCHTTNDVGPIKVWRTERIQDGVERFEYSAGLHAVGRWQGDERLLRDAAAELQVAPAELPAAAARFFSEWKEQRKLLEEVRSQLAQLKADAAAGEAEEVGGVRLIVQDDLDPGALQKTATELLGDGKTVVLLAAPAGDAPVRLLFGRSPDVDVDMGAVLREAASVMGGKGGGRPDFAQGAGPDAGRLGDALQAARDLVAKALA